MSISDLPDGTARILLESALPIRYDVVDSEYRTVTSGVGTLDATVAPGIYQIWKSMGAQSESKLVAIRANAQYEERSVWLDFATAAPLEGSRTCETAHAEIIAQASDSLAAQDAVGAQVVIMVRDAGSVPHQRRWRAELLDSEMAPVLQDVTAGAEPECTLVTACVEPGGHVLALTEQEAEFTHYVPLWLGNDAQTLVFLCIQDAPDDALLSVHLIEKNARWADQSQFALCLAEILQQALGADKVALPADLEGMLTIAVGSPSLALSLAAAMVASNGASSPEMSRLRPILTNLLAGYPDLQLLFPRSGRALSLPFPPLFDIAEMDRPGAVFADGTFARRIAPVLSRYGSFSSWSMPVGQSLDTFLDEAAAELVQGYLVMNPAVMGAHDHDRRIAEQTGLAQAQVRRVLDQDLVSKAQDLRPALTQALTKLAVWDGEDETRTLRTNDFVLSLQMSRRGHRNTMMVDSLVALSSGLPVERALVDVLTAGLMVSVRDSSGINRLAEFANRVAAWTTDRPLPTALHLADRLSVLGKLAVGIGPGIEVAPSFRTDVRTTTQRTIFEHTGMEVDLTVDERGHAGVRVISRDPHPHRRYTLLKAVAEHGDQELDLVIPLTWLASGGFATGSLNLGVMVTSPRVFVVPEPADDPADVGLATFRMSRSRAGDSITERALDAAIEDLLDTGM